MDRKKIFGLIDCNNFYASCERIFNPKLANKPLIVLSNNDGCVIARSDEAKQLGIRMGVPFFEINDLIEKNEVAVFSTNYTLYGDISHRVMSLIASMVPDMEIYSIDEAFIELPEMKTDALIEWGQKLKQTIFQWIGIPVSIGFGVTKTLAKMANAIAKRNKEYEGVFSIHEFEKNNILRSFALENIWGVGPSYLKFFSGISISNARELANQNEFRVKEKIGVMGQRIILELRGIVCYGLNDNPEEKKEFTLSRSFGKALTAYEDIEKALTAYTRQLASRLRKNQYLAKNMAVFVMTNKYAKGPRYVNFETLNLSKPTNDTFQMTHHAIEGLKKIYRKGYYYKKAGIIVQEVLTEGEVQTALWEDENKSRQEKLSTLLDKINARHHSEKLKLAVEGMDKNWKMRQNSLSPKYTTNWDEILKVDMDRIYKN